MKQYLGVLSLVAALTTVRPFAGQTPSAQSAATLLSAAYQAFSGSTPVTSITLQGTIVRTIPGADDQGSFSRTVGADGSFSSKEVLETAGTRTEQRTSPANGVSCSWVSADGTPHTQSFETCLLPADVFLPTLAMQPSALQPYTQVSYLGDDSPPYMSTQAPHLQLTTLFASLPLLNGSSSARLNVDVWFDTTSHLPLAVQYLLPPDHGGTTPIRFTFVYRSYQSSRGLQVPQTVLEYVNDALTATVNITSATQQ